MSTYVVGDVQGCFNELMHLLGLVRFNQQTDQLWFAGDLINRGPASLATLEFVMGLPNAKIVLGNHDLHFLAVACKVQTQGKSDTMDEILTSPALEKIIEWYRQQPLAHLSDDGNWLMVHAGVPPVWSLEETLACADEVQTALMGPDYLTFLQEMYGNQPDCWSDQLGGNDRLRVITNYLTRLRYCTATGKMELTHKSDIQPQGYQPWFSFPNQLPTDLTVLFGHWAALEGKTDSAQAVALDTGCVWGRHLTCLRLEDRQRFSVPASHHFSSN